MVVPPTWSFVLGALAAWRIYKLLSVDDILDAPRERLAPEGSKRREFLECPYCAGFWVSALGSLGWYLLEDFDVYGWLVTAFAMSAVVVFLEVLLDLTVAKKDLAEVHADEVDD
jgi:uncharacterized protein DUF1360